MAEMTTMNSRTGRDESGHAARAARRPISPRVYSLALLIVLLVAWEAGVRIFQVPSWLIPPVSDIAVALWRGLATGPLARDGFWYHSFVTMSGTVLGYLVGCGLGFALAVAIS